MSNQPDTSVGGAGVILPDRVQQAQQWPAIHQQAQYAINQRTSAEQELIEHEQLQSAIAIAGAVCHELNQPLQVLCGLVDLLLLDSPADDPRTEYLRIMAEQVERMAEVIRQLRNITCYKTKPYGSSHQIVDLEQSAAPDDTRTSVAQPA